VRTAARVDRNQKEIMAWLKNHGYSVQSLAQIGKGCPDLLVGKFGQNYLIEVKDGAKTKSAQRLTKAQGKFHSEWKGTIEVITCIEELEIWNRRNLN
jgi:hypothetical protein